MAGNEDFFREKHRFLYHYFYDLNRDGVLTKEDFEAMAREYAVVQRRGKFEEDVVDRWKAVTAKWWLELYQNADRNKDEKVDFEEWLNYFKSMRTSLKNAEDLPDFLKGFLQLHFVFLDHNKDGLICTKDYKHYLQTRQMDPNRAEEAFQSLISERDAETGNKLSRERFNELFLDFLSSLDPRSPGKFICGPLDYQTKGDSPS
ncbi:unnamed protein product [Darwinula stevensoni]|uniref:EF-hand domain-containing protein n=1 Tax=Darwinula stevensoni TaxID=69355 RepID=A0A7R9ACQ3_9CRUS|nr:unnamed protein product [Darwinula stevensoni]CAG0900051.1 unnamed protein product [Darwinula stevensoni]